MRYRVTLSNALLGSSILEKEPKGLNDIAPTIKRGPNHGLTEEIDVKLEFYCGAGKEYIDQVVDEQGPGAEIKIYLDYACGCEPGSSAPDYSIDYSDDYGSQTSGDCDVQEFYVGRLDLKTWESDKEFTKVNIDPDGILQTVKNRLNTKVDLFALETMNGTALDPLTYGPYDLTLHSKKLKFNSNFIQDPSNVSKAALGLADGDKFIYPLIINQTELDETRDPIGEPVEENPIFYSGSVYPVGVATRDISVTGRLKFSVEWFRNHFKLQLRATDSDFNNLDNFELADWSYNDLVVQNETVDIVVNKTFTLPPNSYIYLFFDVINVSGSGVPSINWDFELDSVLEMKEESTTPATTAKAFAVFEAGAQIARVISDQPDAFRSEYFGRKNSEPFAYDNNGCGSFRSFLNGFMIRGFPTTDRTIRLSMNDYFNGLNAIDNLGLGIEKSGDEYHVVVDRKEYFYDSSTVLLTLNHIPDLKRSIAPEYIYSLINVGFEKWETEFINGLDEFNSKRQFDTLNNFVDNELNLLSGFVASGHRLELTRRKQFSESFTEDSEYDEDNFIVCLSKSVDGSGVPDELNITEKNENFDSVENVYSPETAYNLDISPERNLLRWGNVINAGLTKYPGRQIKFTSGEGNYKVETDYTNSTCPGRWNNEPFAGGQDFAWDDVNNSDKDPIWLPIVFEFEFPLTRSQYEVIRAYPKGVIEVSSSDTGHEKAFILDLKYREGGVSAFKLLKSFE